MARMLRKITCHNAPSFLCSPPQGDGGRGGALPGPHRRGGKDDNGPAAPRGQPLCVLQAPFVRHICEVLKFLSKINCSALQFFLRKIKIRMDIKNEREKVRLLGWSPTLNFWVKCIDIFLNGNFKSSWNWGSLQVLSTLFFSHFDCILGCSCHILFILSVTRSLSLSIFFLVVYVCRELGLFSCLWTLVVSLVKPTISHCRVTRATASRCMEFSLVSWSSEAWCRSCAHIFMKMLICVILISFFMAE